jgi:hypothetical protein
MSVYLLRDFCFLFITTVCRTDGNLGVDFVSVGCLRASPPACDVGNVSIFDQLAVWLVFYLHLSHESSSDAQMLPISRDSCFLGKEVIEANFQVSQFMTVHVHFYIHPDVKDVFYLRPQVA